MPYKKQIEELEKQLKEFRAKQKNHDRVTNEKQKIYLIEEGIDDDNAPYLICENVTGLSFSEIDEIVEEESETNEGADFKEWSFRLSSTPKEEYGLEAWSL